MLEIAFPSIWISNFSGGACPQTPLEGGAVIAQPLTLVDHLLTSDFIENPVLQTRALIDKLNSHHVLVNFGLFRMICSMAINF